MTAEQWDDEWWRYWEAAKRFHPGELAAHHADFEMSERYGLRPDDPLPLRGFHDLLAEIFAADAPVSPEPPDAWRAPTTTELGGVSMEEIIAAYSVPGPVLGLPRETVRLTEWQRAELLRLYPPDRGPYKFGGGVGDLTARPIELVESEADSDFPLWRPYATGGVIRGPVLLGGPDPAEFIQRADREGRIRVARNGQIRIRSEFEPRRGWLRRALEWVLG